MPVAAVLRACDWLVFPPEPCTSSGGRLPGAFFMGRWISACAFVFDMNHMFNCSLHNKKETFNITYEILDYAR